LPVRCPFNDSASWSCTSAHSGDHSGWGNAPPCGWGVASTSNTHSIRGTATGFVSRRSSKFDSSCTAVEWACSIASRVANTPPSGSWVSGSLFAQTGRLGGQAGTWSLPAGGLFADVGEKILYPPFGAADRAAGLLRRAHCLQARVQARKPHHEVFPVFTEVRQWCHS
jgi:hypothetical protein